MLVQSRSVKGIFIVLSKWQMDLLAFCMSIVVLRLPCQGERRYSVRWCSLFLTVLMGTTAFLYMVFKHPKCSSRCVRFVSFFARACTRVWMFVCALHQALYRVLIFRDGSCPGSRGSRRVCILLLTVGGPGVFLSQRGPTLRGGGSIQQALFSSQELQARLQISPTPWRSPLM